MNNAKKKTINNFQFHSRFSGYKMASLRVFFLHVQGQNFHSRKFSGKGGKRFKLFSFQMQKDWRTNPLSCTRKFTKSMKQAYKLTHQHIPSVHNQQHFHISVPKHWNPFRWYQYDFVQMCVNIFPLASIIFHPCKNKENIPTIWCSSSA